MVILQKLHNQRLEDAYRTNSAHFQLENLIPEKLINQNLVQNELLPANLLQASTTNVCLSEINPYLTGSLPHPNTHYNPYTSTGTKELLPNSLINDKIDNHYERFANLDIKRFPFAPKSSENECTSSAIDKNEEEILFSLMLSQDEPQKLKINKLKSANGLQNNVKVNRIETEDEEECKLIEDLFFLK
jgi:hypothetical protein